jgi:hypothetical protein
MSFDKVTFPFWKFGQGSQNVASLPQKVSEQGAQLSSRIDGSREEEKASGTGSTNLFMFIVLVKFNMPTPGTLLDKEALLGLCAMRVCCVRAVAKRCAQPTVSRHGKYSICEIPAAVTQTPAADPVSPPSLVPNVLLPTVLMTSHCLER